MAVMIYTENLSCKDKDKYKQQYNFEVVISVDTGFLGFQELSEYQTFKDGGKNETYQNNR